MKQMAYKVIFHDRADVTTLTTLEARILGPGHKRGFLAECFEQLEQVELTPQPNYIIIDLSPLSHVPRSCLFRSAIFPDEVTKLLTPIFFLI